MRPATGIAQSWRTNHAAAQADYAERLAYYELLSAAQQATRKAPLWNAWDLPILKAVCIQANANVALRVTDDYAALALVLTDKSQFDCWIRLSTLDKGLPVYLPIKLATYHRKVLAGLKPNSNLTLNRRKGQWSLTLTAGRYRTSRTRANHAAVQVVMSAFATTSWIIVATVSAG